MITLVTLFFAIPWVVYGFSQEQGGLFWQTGDGTGEIDAQRAEDLLEHEKKVEWDTQDIVAFCCAAVLIMIAAGKSYLLLLLAVDFLSNLFFLEEEA